MQIEVHLYNYDVNVFSPMKQEHTRFLDEKIVPALKANPSGRASLYGSASRSGDEAKINGPLSESRAGAVRAYLAASGVGGQVTGASGLSEPGGAGPMEDENDRAVFIFLKLPVAPTDIDLWTDDWARRLTWDDIIGFGGIRKMNLQMEVSGVPRYWDLDGGVNVALMPPDWLLEAVGMRSGDWINRRQWIMPKAPALAQPNDLFKTLYRLSDDVERMGFERSVKPGVATIHREKNPISLGLRGLGWKDRGEAEQGVASSQDHGRIDALKLLQAGGAELCYMRGWNPTWALKWLVRSPAEVLFYAGNGNANGCLSRVGECWASPKDLQGHWANQSQMKMLIVAAPKVLKMTVGNNRIASGAPGMDWAKLLKSKGGPFGAILGYRDAAPAIKGVGEDIAGAMGKKIAQGMPEDQWVKTWLRINGDHPGTNTWNAVGMDQKGYWWIHDRSAWEQSFDLVPGFGPGYEIKGPAVIA